MSLFNKIILYFSHRLVKEYLNEQCQYKEKNSLHSHVRYDDPNPWPLKRKNIVHKADWTGWKFTKPKVNWRKQY